MKFKQTFTGHLVNLLTDEDDDSVFSGLYDAPIHSVIDDYLDEPYLVFKVIWDDYIGRLISPNTSYESYHREVENSIDFLDINSVVIPDGDDALRIARARQEIVLKEKAKSYLVKSKKKGLEIFLILILITILIRMLDVKLMIVLMNQH